MLHLQHSPVHPALMTMHPAPLTVHQALLTVHQAPLTVHPALLTVHPAPLTWQCTQNCWQCTQHCWQCTQHRWPCTKHCWHDSAPSTADSAGWNKTRLAHTGPHKFSLTGNTMAPRGGVLCGAKGRGQDYRVGPRKKIKTTGVRQRGEGWVVREHVPLITAVDVAGLSEVPRSDDLTIKHDSFHTASEMGAWQHRRLQLWTHNEYWWLS